MFQIQNQTSCILKTKTNVFFWIQNLTRKFLIQNPAFSIVFSDSCWNFIKELPISKNHLLEHDNGMG